MGLDVTTIGTVAALAPVAVWSVRREMRRQRRARQALEEVRAKGLDEPASLHPVIDLSRCVGCGSCVAACPEAGVLQLVDGRAHLVHASHCVGHGLCKTACPQKAIELVFGTERRGVQVPELGGDYQTNVPGIYIAGELGGMGLIRNAILQGTQAVREIRRTLEPRRGGQDLDVAIVGAGPAGIAAALACREHGLSFALLDQDGLGGSVNHYPRQKLVMTSPAHLPIVGKFQFHEVRKEELLAFWNDVVRQTQLEIRAPERVIDVQRQGDGFRVTTDRGSLQARRVVLAIGRRGTPRKLGVPGEASSHVAYRLLEPEHSSGESVLVVGGGNSAIEAAVSLAEAGARTTLSYRSNAFGRVAPANVERLESMRGDRLEVLLQSQVQRIDSGFVQLETASGARRLDIDRVFVLIGGELPSQFLEKIGVTMHTYHGETRRAPQRPVCA